ncbi:hypothetical protein ACNF36_02030 [Mycoplasma sp. 4463]|uniref:hypothetical protein n=1 Tax=Mycoplasma sp. 4463 TaxID=3400998 RepID=UPI003AAAD5BF
MKINFKSIIKVSTNDEPQVIEFLSQLDLYNKTEDGVIELKFNEPKYNETNRIDISENEVNIYTNLTTVCVKKNEEGNASISVVDPSTQKKFEINLKTVCKNFFTSINEFNFQYDLFTYENDEVLTSINMTLELYE